MWLETRQGRPCERLLVEHRGRFVRMAQEAATCCRWGLRPCHEAIVLVGNDNPRGPKKAWRQDSNDAQPVVGELSAAKEDQKGGVLTTRGQAHSSVATPGEAKKETKTRPWKTSATDKHSAPKRKHEASNPNNVA